jgi:hypothetical protein
MTKAASVLLIAATTCTCVLAFLVQFDVLPFPALAALISANALFAFRIRQPLDSHGRLPSELLLLSPGPNIRRFGPPSRLRVGFYILWVFFICSLANASDG